MVPDRVGRFRIEAPLGQGGMGEVYLAVDEELRRKVAIKALPSAVAGDERLRERLRTEARTVAAVSHPSVGQIHDVISEGPNHYLVLEYVEGESLASLLGNGTVPLGDALDLAVDMADGLEAAHAQGIVHRDLKAENVMVTPAGRAKILDFGLAKVLLERAREASDDGAPGKGIAGTLSAMSPEQVERRSVDHRSDLFSFGTLLYQLVVGTHPFRQGLPVETMQRIVSHEPNPPHRANPQVSRGLSLLIMELLAKEVEMRPAEASEVADRLRRIRGELEADASDAARELKARKRRLVIASVAAASVLAVGLGVWWWLRPPAPAQPLTIAVMRPQILGEDPHSRIHLVASGARLGIINTLTGLEGASVVNTGDVDAVDGTVKEVARAVAAEEVISTTITAADATYLLVISRLNGGNGSILWTDQVEVPVDGLHFVAEAAATYMDTAYPDRRRRPGAIEISAGPAAYEAFLETRERVLNPAPDVSWPELMAELEAIREASPALLNAHILEASIARYLYTATRDPKFISHGEEVIQAAIEIAPDDYRTLLAEAESAAAWGQLERSEAALDRLQRQEPASTAVMSQRAWLARRSGDVDQALALFEVVAQRRPSWRNLFNLAVAEENEGMVESARMHLEQALELSLGNFVMLAALASFELENGDLDRAEALYLEVTAGSPQPQYLSSLGTVEMLLGRYDEALESFSRAFAMGSVSPVMMLNLADCHALLGNDDEASGLYAEIVDTVTAEPNPRIKDLELLAQALAQLERSDEASAVADRALALAPGASGTTFTASLVHAKAGNVEAARGYCERALDAGMDPRWFELLWFDEVLRPGSDVADSRSAPPVSPGNL